MTTATATDPIQREPELLGQTVVVIGGSSGIGWETARRARAEGAEVILTGRNPERLQQAASDVDAQRTAAFDANDPAALESFFGDLPSPINHVMVSGGGPQYKRDEIRSAVLERGWSEKRQAFARPGPWSRGRRRRRAGSPRRGGVARQASLIGSRAAADGPIKR
jgi:hypothetical protein